MKVNTLHPSLLAAASLLALSPLGVPAGAQAPSPAKEKPLPYTGTNFAGADFGDVKPGDVGQPNKSYTYPNQGEFDYFTKAGMNVFRLPFRWERLQSVAKGEFDAAELARLKEAVQRATSKGSVVILDPHNYARYYGEMVGGPKVGADVFADFWKRLATEFKGDSRVWFGLVNEPHDMPGDVWLSDANAAIAAIRKAGAKNRILVPGNSWTGAHSWVGSGNAVTMLGIVDPAGNYAFDVHQYLDKDSSGSHPEVVSATIGSERLREFTLWCRKNKKQAFLGEVGVASDPTSLTAIGNMLDFMQANRDVWMGFTWWAAGPWWGDYMYTIEPTGEGKERAQLTTLRPYLQKK